MKKKLFTLVASVALGLPMFAAFYMCVKLDSDNIIKFDVDELEEVLYDKLGASQDTTSSKSYMNIKQKGGKTVSYDVKEIKEVYYESIVDTSVVDVAESPLRFRTLSDSTAELSGYDKKYFVDEDGMIEEKEIKVPANVLIDSVVYNVVGIGKEAFSKCAGLTNIEIPSSVTYIEEKAFSNCKGLKTINIPSGVTSIGEEAFQSCTGLTELLIPSSVTNISEWAFYGCTYLDVVVDNSKENVEVGKSAFEGCKSVTFTKDESVAPDTTHTQLLYKILSDSTVAYNGECKESVIIPDTVRIDGSLYTVSEIANRAFRDCDILRYVKIPSSVRWFGFEAFENCKNLSTVNIPSGITEIDSFTFANCSSLTSIEIPESVEYIEKQAFAGCVGLTNIVISSNVKFIGENAFKGCKNLDIVIDNYQDNVHTYNSPFEGCKSVTYTKVDSTVIDESETPLKFWIQSDSTVEVSHDDSYYETELDTIVVPSKVRIEGRIYKVAGIGSRALTGCDSLYGIVIPSCITHIGDTALTLCRNLEYIEVDSANPNYTSVDGILYNKDTTLLICVPAGKRGEITIPSSVTEIEYEAFYECANLTKVTIPESITKIPYKAFANCKNLDVVIDNYQDNVTFDEWSFMGCKSVTFAKIDESIVDEADSPLNFSILSDSTAEISKCDAKKVFGAIEILPKVRIKGKVYVVTSIGNSAFEKCTVLTSIKIPSTVTSIGNAAFNFCTTLTKVEIPESVVSIGDEAFTDCTNLKSIEIPSSVTSIGRLAFGYCKNLVIVINNLEENVESGENAFYGVKSVTYGE